MSVDPIDPENFGEDLSGRRGAEHEQQVLAALSADLAGSPAAELAAQLQPVVQDGGHLGRAVAPAVSRLTRTREGLRIWGPALATTAAAVTAVAVLSLPGPLSLYVLALAAFAWWHCAGRPGPIDSVRMLTGAVAEQYDSVRRRITRLGERRGAYEARRTSTDSGSQ